MENDPVIIEPSTPLVYNDTIDTTSMTNILLIDSSVRDKQVFYDSANANTFPIIYDSTSTTDDLLALLRQKFPTSSIERISLVFHDRGPYVQAPFMNNKIFFEESDLEPNQTSFSENVSFLISCIKEFHVSHIDYLACNTLQYSNWKSYYALLASETSVMIGASNDATGNMQYGGDWVMESTSENVMNIYFNANISNYVSLLASTITQNGGYVYLRMDSSGQFVQSSSNGSTWSTIVAASWPITITNSSPSAGNILRVVLTAAISMSITYTGSTNSYLIAGSTYITFDGSSNYVRVNGITSYPGFIQNGTSGANGKANVVVQNFITDISGSTTLSSNGGWLCQPYFGKGVTANSITNCKNYALIDGSGNGYGGGIAGKYAGNSGTLTFTNCTNYGDIYVYYGGGIAGSDCAYSSGTATFNSCVNNGKIIGYTGTAPSPSPTQTGPGGIAGLYAGSAGNVTFLDCVNNGEITASDGGGIAGSDCAYSSGTATFNRCVNNGYINGISVGSPRIGGIVGTRAGGNSGTCSVSYCINTGIIEAVFAGGIVGAQAGSSSGTINVSNCFNIGDMINASQSGGIAGLTFGFFTSNTCSISNCYSFGRISGVGSGGIAGGEIGRSNLSHTVNVSNCYCLSDIGSSCGGILGGASNNYNTSVVVTINVTNCYSSGLLTGTGEGLVSVDLQAKVGVDLVINTPNCYIANGDWEDASANTSLTGVPTNFTTNNPGITWTTLGTNIPYVLSAYIAQLYNPNSASTTSSYRTAPGLFQPNYTYMKIKAIQVSNVLTTFAFTSKGTSPYYYAYNYNSFALTNTNSNGSSTTMTSSVNSLTGEIDIIVPAPLGPITITANGSIQSVYLRMNGTLIEYGFSINGPWSLIAINANWPVTIANSNPGSSSILNVIFIESLTISNTYGNTSGYFIIGTQYITFNGGNNNININNITGYGGFIQNGTSSLAGQSNVSVTNIIANVNSSTLSVGSGWICRAYFGRGPSSGGVLCLNNSVVNCTNNGNINVNSAGGIAGRNAGYNGNLSFTNCVNTGVISAPLGGGGIAGQYAGLCDTSADTLITFTGCVNNGLISGYGCGGIAGRYAGNGRNPILSNSSTYIYQARSIFTNCSNTGNITGDTSGGIAGQYPGYNTGKNTSASYATSFINCDNTGSVYGIYAGGIVGEYAGGGFG